MSEHKQVHYYTSMQFPVDVPPPGLSHQSLQMSSPLPRPIRIIFQHFRKLLSLHSANMLSPECLRGHFESQPNVIVFCYLQYFLAFRSASKCLFVVILIHFKTSAVILVLSVAFSVKILLPNVSNKTPRNFNSLTVFGFRVLKFRV